MTLHQKEVLNACLKALKKEQILLLKGSAGVGKTYLVSILIEKLYNKNMIRDVAITAPTHKALSVLIEKQSSNNFDCSFKTIHSLLKLKKIINEQTGKEEYIMGSSENPFDILDLVIIDEASMINENLLNIIENYLIERNTKIIFIGDEKQINPVKEKNSIVFKKGYKTFELKEIIRQNKNNPIIKLSNNLKLLKIGKSNFIKQVLENNIEQIIGYGFSTNKEMVKKILKKNNGSDEYKYLAWTNENVDSTNKIIRELIYNDDKNVFKIPNKIEKNEILIFNSSYKGKFHKNELIKIKNFVIKNTTFDVPDLIINGKITFKKIEFLCYDIRNNEKDCNLYIIHESYEKKYKSILREIVKKIRNKQLKWKYYYLFIEKFADLKHNHALTIHKSQGSTYDKVIINYIDVMKNKNIIERNRLLYTAITRARYKVLILK